MQLDIPHLPVHFPSWLEHLAVHETLQIAFAHKHIRVAILTLRPEHKRHIAALNQPDLVFLLRAVRTNAQEILHRPKYQAVTKNWHHRPGEYFHLFNDGNHSGRLCLWPDYLILHSLENLFEAG